MNFSDKNSVELTTEQLILLEATLAIQKKSMETAVLLWMILGFVGVHDFYFHRVGYAILKIVFFVFSIPFIVSPVIVSQGVEVSGVDLGFVFEWSMGFTGILFIWWVGDVFLLGERIKEDTQTKRQETIQALQDSLSK